MEKALNPDKFELGDIVEPKHRAAAKFFECGACACIPLNPVQAPPSSECGHVFCDSCADEPRCSFCEEDLPSAERQPLLEDNMMSKWYAMLPVHCPYSSAHSKSSNSESLDSSFGDTETCAEDQETTDEEKETHGEEKQVRHMTPAVVEEVQCGWKGTMQEMRSHLLECPFQLIKCPSGIAFRRKDIENHRQTDCHCSFERCPICHERVKVGTMEQHRAEKAGEHVPLLEEKLKEQENDIKAWENRFSELDGTVKEREKEIKASEERISELEGMAKEREAAIKASEKRISELEGTVKEVLAQQSSASTFEWEIKNPAKMKAKHPKIHEQFFSPEFFLRGLGPWKVQIRPSGDSSNPGGVGVFLHGSASTASAKVECRLTVNGKAHELSERAIAGDGWGPPKFPGFAWPASDTEPVRVKVEFLKVTNLAVTK